MSGVRFCVIPHCLRQDNTLNIGGTYHVILNLIQDLNKIRSRNESGMTEVSCHPEGEARRISLSKRFFAGAQNDKNTFLVPYCLSNLVSSKKAAFTLAEVLITLGIIGIVAATTIPTLVTNYQKKQTVAKLQKAYSILSNMTKLLYADNSYSALSGAVSAEKTEQFFNLYVLNYFRAPELFQDNVCPYSDSAEWCYAFKYLNGRVMDTSVFTKYDAGRVYFTTNDGIAYYFSIMYWNRYSDSEGNEYKDALYTSSPHGVVDINGTEGPNILGKDVFVFQSDFANGVMQLECANSSNEEVNADCSLTGSGQCCAEKIRRDGWKISDDYPWI